MSRRLRLRTALVVTVTTLITVGCGGTTPPTPSTNAGGGASSARVQGEITVFAAASLTEAFTAIGRQFEAAHPGTKVTFSFGPSSGLANQITAGAPADVFAPASTSEMQRVADAGAVRTWRAFATNVLEIAVPPPNPAGVTGVADLARPGVKVVLCQAQVPCGTVAAKVLANAGVRVTAVSQEADVKAVLSKVVLGEADAGVVYATDVRAAGAKVKGIEIPAGVNASTQYPIAALEQATNAPTARAFVDFVLSDAGRSVLSAAGFQAPRP